MDVILCATRGGEASVRSQQRAIEIAKENNAKLVFIFVSDVRFLEKYSAKHVPGMDQEMENLGEFLLLMAKERAEKEGVEADYTVRSGDFKAALVEAAKDVGAELIVLGRPADDNVTTMDYLENTLSPALKEETGCDVQVV